MRDSRARHGAVTLRSMVVARWSKHWWRGAACAVLVGACGGKSVVGGTDPGGAANAGGATHAGGAAHAGGATHAGGAGSSGGPSTGCPDRQPKQGDPCGSPFGTSCNYAIDECSSATFECIQGVWVQAPRLDGAADDCSSFAPENAPKDGDSCRCLGMLDCSYTDCSGRGRIHAVCDNAAWHVTETPCTKQPCGPDGLECDWPGKVCVVHAQRVPAFECMKNPCASGPVTCDCAAPLCSAFEECSIDSGAVACFCPSC